MYLTNASYMVTSLALRQSYFIPIVNEATQNNMSKH